MCYANCLILYLALVGLTLLPQPAWADSKKDLCDAEGGMLSRNHRQSPNPSNWAIANSFRAAYLAWDTVENCPKSREFDFDDYPLYQFYVLQIDWSKDFQTGILKHEFSFGIELTKNPIALTSRDINLQSIEQFNWYPLKNSIPFSQADFISKQNSLSLYIENTMALGKRIEVSFEGNLELVINDTTDLPDLPTISQQDYEAFSPELEISYQFSDSVSVYANLSYSSLPIIKSSSVLQPEIENGLEVGIETELIDERVYATIYFYDGTQKNVFLTSANDAELEVFVDEQQSQEIGFEVSGEITPGWDFIAYYAYTDARLSKLNYFGVGRQVPDIAIHSGGFWTTYEIQAGNLQGLGFGGGVRFIGDRPRDIDNTFKLPSYWQTDIAIFYQRNNWKAALSIENLFDVEYFNGTPLTVLGTVLIEF